MHNATLACLIPTLLTVAITRIHLCELDTTSGAVLSRWLASGSLRLLLSFVRVVHDIQLLLDLATILVILPIHFLTPFTGNNASAIQLGSQNDCPLSTYEQ